jgi:hypothetical protein
VTAFRPLTLAGDQLDGVRVLVPSVARVVRRGAAIEGTLGDVSGPDPQADEEARSFARALVASGQVRTAPRARRRLAAAPEPAPGRPHRPTHEVRVVDDQPTLVRVGFAI